VRTEWIDPRPQWPPSGTRCVVKCDDGTLRVATAEDTWDGWCWKDPRTGFWSMAHPRVIGWKPYHATDPDEREKADRFEDARLPKEYQRYSQSDAGVNHA
jgi:hypothetical protein